MIRKRHKFCLVFAIWVGAYGCTAPKQAQFTLEPCGESIAFDPLSAAWRVEPEPQLLRGTEGAWDDSDVLNPSVVRVGRDYYNFYSGFDGATWRTGLATSTDGISWQRHPANPLFEPDASSWEGEYIAANGTVAHTGATFLHWYQAATRRPGLRSSLPSRSRGTRKR